MQRMLLLLLLASSVLHEIGRPCWPSQSASWELPLPQHEDLYCLWYLWYLGLQSLNSKLCWHLFGLLCNPGGVDDDVRV